MCGTALIAVLMAALQAGELLHTWYGIKCSISDSVTGWGVPSYVIRH